MGKLHNRKKHITIREIELFIEEKLSKPELENLKNKYKSELILNKSILLDQKKHLPDNVFEMELSEYNKHITKQKELLKILKTIFPEDDELKNINIDIE
ncbi:hypothetical protein EV215_0853 [Hypnocyclicus thermotrophus]|uniref:Uncharacterized protein n=1 Tax=Hypnocyclicus thermotrophus TaxID=1627895 RepID=A0AA46DZQ2_9FUSO|nr:hypothetical protein [Hypnocyclicus thermotrophus]TDT71477.1 hypothetical protein EV215_0853 [Hypnocyclicus thermotrophus]